MFYKISEPIPTKQDIYEDYEDHFKAQVNIFDLKVSNIQLPKVFEVRSIIRSPKTIDAFLFS